MSHTFSDGQTLCPYNDSHVVSRLRVIPHLVKCRQQHPHLMEKIKICPYNQGHHIPSQEMTTHLATCKEFESSKLGLSERVHQQGNSSQKKSGATSTTKLAAILKDFDDEEFAEWN
ncbi:gametocyte-specific factor 1-like [Folsomia candida]|uniref:gametocyte-specific factor 1-like n=1 Tax=Folsomia candida TaxID=158441 RepID=UPI000B900012|nr:gametocyte-specific factor 1-like [Folsomia candida]